MFKYTHIIFVHNLSEGHLDQLEGEAFMEDAVDPGTARQLCRVDLVPGALYTFLKVHRELLNHPAGKQITVHACDYVSIYRYTFRTISLSLLPSIHLLTGAEPWSCETDHPV